MFIKVEQVICGEIERWIFIDPRTIHVEADRSVSDPSRIVYFMYARSKSEGKVIVRTSSDAAELLDLRDTYWKQVFFSPENFYKMRVDRFKNATYVTNKG